MYVKEYCIGVIMYLLFGYSYDLHYCILTLWYFTITILKCFLKSLEQIRIKSFFGRIFWPWIFFIDIFFFNQKILSRYYNSHFKKLYNIMTFRPLIVMTEGRLNLFFSSDLLFWSPV